MKIIFWGSSDFSMPSLEMCLKDFEVIAVVTNADSTCGRGMKDLKMTPVKQAAVERNIPVLQPCSLKEDSCYLEIEALKADLSVVVSYGMIIPERILKLPKYESVNLHASLLPKYRGASPIQAALSNGDKITGNTVQFMSKKMDEGDIILQREHIVNPEDHYSSLLEKLGKEGAELLKETIQLIEQGKAPRISQKSEEATYTRLIKRSDGRVVFRTMSADEIIRKWKAFDPWPGIYSEYHNSDTPKSGIPECMLVQIRDLEKESNLSGQAGTIIQADKKGLVIACREGTLRLTKVKPAGKNEMDYQAFNNGYKPEKGRYF